MTKKYSEILGKDILRQMEKIVDALKHMPDDADFRAIARKIEGARARLLRIHERSRELSSPPVSPRMLRRGSERFINIPKITDWFAMSPPALRRTAQLLAGDYGKIESLHLEIGKVFFGGEDKDSIQITGFFTRPDNHAHHVGTVMCSWTHTYDEVRRGLVLHAEHSSLSVGRNRRYSDRGPDALFELHDAMMGLYRRSGVREVSAYLEPPLSRYLAPAYDWDLRKMRQNRTALLNCLREARVSTTLQPHEIQAVEEMIQRVKNQAAPLPPPRVLPGAILDRLEWHGKATL